MMENTILLFIAHAKKWNEIKEKMDALLEKCEIKETSKKYKYIILP